ncbi:MAG: universal stress protein [Burkholderiales bacterium]|nr:universal stress protein [Burkholderiales bacterium]
MPKPSALGMCADILVAIDGSAAGVRAVRHAIARLKSGYDGTIHLLHVQPPFKSGEVSALVTAEMSQEARRCEAEHAVNEAREVLVGALVPHKVLVVTGAVADTIVNQAAGLGCGEIVMGTRGLGAVGNLVLGSVAARVVRLSSVPVTLVK